MYAKRMSLQDCISPATEITTEYVLICKTDTGGFKLAYEGGFLSHVGDDFYSCKRTLANNLDLQIISSFPSKIY
jgi:hypothetical protein